MSDHISAKDWRKLHDLEPTEGQKKVYDRLSKKKKPAKSKKAGLGELEKDIQTRILERLGYLKDGFFWRENSGLIQQEYKGKKRVWRSGIKGISDIMGVYQGIGVAIEVKRPGREPTPFQVAFQERYKQAGGIAFICDDDEKVVRQLEVAYKMFKIEQF